MDSWTHSSARDCGVAHDTGNALPVLHEIRHALELLIDSGRETAIDLRALPFAPGDEEMLLSTLGTGEVDATVEALGPTRITETGIHGVWLVTHCNTAGEVMSRLIEVCAVPGLLRSDRSGLVDGLQELNHRLRIQHDRS